MANIYDLSSSDVEWVKQNVGTVPATLDEVNKAVKGVIGSEYGFAVWQDLKVDGSGNLNITRNTRNTFVRVDTSGTATEDILAVVGSGFMDGDMLYLSGLDSSRVASITASTTGIAAYTNPTQLRVDVVFSWVWIGGTFTVIAANLRETVHWVNIAKDAQFFPGPTATYDGVAYAPTSQSIDPTRPYAAGSLFQKFQIGFNGEYSTFQVAIPNNWAIGTSITCEAHFINDNGLDPNGAFQIKYGVKPYSNGTDHTAVVTGTDVFYYSESQLNGDQNVNKVFQFPLDDALFGGPMNQLLYPSGFFTFVVIRDYSVVSPDDDQSDDQILVMLKFIFKTN